MTNIGVFDSGLGGLTVLSKLAKEKNANYFYFGDSKRAPYGSRDKETIIKFTEEIVDFLEDFDIDTYVIACNTISVIATDYLCNKYGKNFIPISDAGVKKALEYDGDYLVLATETTVNSHYYRETLGEQSEDLVYEVNAGGMVRLIEDGKTDSPEMDELLENYLKFANENKIPNIILACTHFPLAADAIKKNLNYEASLINPADRIVKSLDIAQNEKNKIHIFMSEINDNTLAVIDSLIESDYELLCKEL